MPVPNKYRLESCRARLFALVKLNCLWMQPLSDYCAVVFVLRSAKLDPMSLLSLITSWCVLVDAQCGPEGMCHSCSRTGSCWAAKLHTCRGFPSYGSIRLVLCRLAVVCGVYYCSIPSRQNRSANVFGWQCSSPDCRRPEMKKSHSLWVHGASR